MVDRPASQAEVVGRQPSRPPTGTPMDFPLELRFKILAIASQISVTDANGNTLCYVKQKAFKLKEAVTVYSDASQATALYRITADRIIDIAARYAIEDATTGAQLGTLQRHGMRSFWRAHYELHRDGQPAYQLREENPWTKVADNMFGQIPVLGMFTGYLFHPAYRLTRAGTDQAVLRVVKRPALFEGVYRLEEQAPLSDDEQRLGLLAILMMLLLERSRG